MVTVAVTGARGFVGRALLCELDADRSVERIIGVDVVEPDMPVGKLDFVPAAGGAPELAVAFDGADVVVHAASEEMLTRDDDAAFAEHVHGAGDVLAAAARAGVNRFLLVSSAMVYGAHPDNDVPLDEDAPLRANPDFGHAYRRMLVEHLVREWAAAHPQVTVTILRAATTLGPGADGFAVRHLESPRLPLIRGHETPLQFLHVDDLAAACRMAVTGGLAGTYNVASDGWLSASEVCALLGRRPVRLPEATAFAAMRRLWPWGLSNLPAGALHYLMHPWVVATDRIQAAGWAPTRSNRDVLREFAATHHGMVALGRARARRRNVYLGGLGAAGLLSAVPVLWWRLAVRRRALRPRPGILRARLKPG